MTPYSRSYARALQPAASASSTTEGAARSAGDRKTAALGPSTLNAAAEPFIPSGGRWPRGEMLPGPSTSSAQPGPTATASPKKAWGAGPKPWEATSSAQPSGDAGTLSHSNPVLAEKAPAPVRAWGSGPRASVPGTQASSSTSSQQEKVSGVATTSPSSPVSSPSRAVAKSGSPGSAPTSRREFLESLGEPVRRWTGVHRDDVHALIPTQLWGERGLLTGSKDGTVRFTALDSDASSLLLDKEGPHGGHWVTAMARHDSGLTAVGRRSGEASLWDWEGESEALRMECTAVGNAKAKERNQDRIHSLHWASPVAGEGPEQRLLIGMNGRFLRVDPQLGDERIVQADPRAWVYGFAEMDPEHLAVIEGAHLTMQTFQEDVWVSSHLLSGKMHGEGALGEWAEEIRTASLGNGQRLISHIHRVPGAAREVVISQFDGSISLLDLGHLMRPRVTTVCDVSSWTLSQYATARAFSRRVWQSVPVEPQIWACATDDGTLPLVDFRTRSVVRRLASGGSRVSCVAIEDDGKTLYAASCASNPRLSGGASLSVYDLRS